MGRPNCSLLAETAALRCSSGRPKPWEWAPTSRPALIAMHHLDAPWRPADIEQRDGRILRQGNQNPEVRVLRYVTEGSFDTYMWQTLERKAAFIAQVTRGDLPDRDVDDIGDQALSFAEVKALATGDPLVRNNRWNAPSDAGVQGRSSESARVRGAWPCEVKSEERHRHAGSDAVVLPASTGRRRRAPHPRSSRLEDGERRP
ncbi:MAG: hypothetical protein V9F03_08395 [Microthrixaceae bacterium]